MERHLFSAKTNHAGGATLAVQLNPLSHHLVGCIQPVIDDLAPKGAGLAPHCGVITIQNCNARVIHGVQKLTFGLGYLADPSQDL